MSWLYLQFVPPQEEWYARSKWWIIVGKHGLGDQSDMLWT